jgi:hypothetical protein
MMYPKAFLRGHLQGKYMHCLSLSSLISPITLLTMSMYMHQDPSQWEPTVELSEAPTAEL